MLILGRALAYAALFIGLIFVFLPAQILSWSGVSRPAAIGPWQVAGALASGAGGVIAGWCVLTFALLGRGTPAPFDAPRRLVQRGPYGVVRNPMYIGGAFALGGAALFYRSAALAAYTALFLLWAHLFVRLYEEPALRRRFGVEYDSYRARVGRWLPRHARESATPAAASKSRIRPGERGLETQEERVARVVREDIAIVAYDPLWPRLFLAEAAHLRSCLPGELVGRIEHFGSTAVPGLVAKPIIDMLVEVADLQATRERIAPLLERQGYDFFWRPTQGDDGPPFYAWFIKRDATTGARTHHIHMVERHFSEHWDRLLFRDYLIAHPEVTTEYAALKVRLAAEWPQDRVAYTNGKTAFIVRVTALAKRDKDGM